MQMVVAESEVWDQTFGVQPQPEESSGGSFVREVRIPINESDELHLTWDAVDRSVRVRRLHGAAVGLDLYREGATLITLESSATNKTVILEYGVDGYTGHMRIDLVPTFALRDVLLRG